MLGAAQIPVALAAEAQMQGMDHSQMQGMDHSQMQGMDHSQMQGMDHSQMQGMGQEKVTQSRTPIPELTDADRAAVFIDSDGHAVHDKALNTFFLLDQLEWQDADEGSALSWDVQGWIGGDIDRLWIRSEGERTNGKTEEAEVQVLW
ncbi:copper resistance protein B, partial [Pseudomonas sp.]|uniref:copper resistance protein B n=1 Tax=Pseudomonas sp. TaxID=306 RepID=UPI00289929BD